MVNEIEDIYVIHMSTLFYELLLKNTFIMQRIKSLFIFLIEIKSYNAHSSKIYTLPTLQRPR